MHLRGTQLERAVSECKLCIDVGNSRLNWAWFHCTQESDQGSDDVHTSSDAAHEGQWVHRDRPIQSMIEALKERWVALDQELGAPESVWLASVGNGEIVDQIQSLLDSLWGIQARLIQSTAQQAHVRSGYKQPHKLGVDRWMGLIAAREHYMDQHCIIVDVGTAVTIDALRADGQHLGGVIFPGYYLQQTALRSDTADLAEYSDSDEADDDALPFAGTTQEGIAAGTLASLVGGVESLVAQMKQHFKGDVNFRVRALITGGDAEMLMAHSSVSFIHIPNLVMDGIKIVADQAAKLSTEEV